jgi:hypothetical protein
MRTLRRKGVSVELVKRISIANNSRCYQEALLAAHCSPSKTPETVFETAWICRLLTEVTMVRKSGRLLSTVNQARDESVLISPSYPIYR